MSNEHTPGPWVVSKTNPTIIKLAPDFLGESNVLIGSSSGHPNSGFFPSDEEAIANARLIAAAPELLEALQYARRFLKPADHDVAFVDAAIAKATGA